MWEKTQVTLFIEEIIRNQDNNETENEGCINVTGGHPRHGEDKDRFAQSVFHMFFKRFAKLHRNKFGTNVEQNHHHSRKEFRSIQIQDVEVTPINNFS